MVRTFVVLSLIGLLTLCPFVCGAAEIGHGPHPHPVSDGSPEYPHGPAHCPEGGDNCICEGAVQAGDVRVPALHDAGPPVLVDAPTHTPPHPVAHLTWDGSPTGLGGWGSSATVRALLQNYRC